jgi:hypothetical protein
MVPRHARIRYRASTPAGEPIEREAEGFHARVVQHECDHLIGRLYPTRMTDLTRLTRPGGTTGASPACCFPRCACARPTVRRAVRACWHRRGLAASRCAAACYRVDVRNDDTFAVPPAVRCDLRFEDAISVARPWPPGSRLQIWRRSAGAQNCAYAWSSIRSTISFARLGGEAADRDEDAECERQRPCVARDDRG